MKKLALTLLLLACGCVSKNSYVEGTCLQLGAYLPVDGNLFGVEVVNYLSGCAVRTATNQTFSVEREYAATNSYFGCVETAERTKTKVEVKK